MSVLHIYGCEFELQANGLFSLKRKGYRREAPRHAIPLGSLDEWRGVVALGDVAELGHAKLAARTGPDLDSPFARYVSVWHPLLAGKSMWDGARDYIRVTRAWLRDAVAELANATGGPMYDNIA